eukprot:gene3318-3595_t
MPQQKCFTVVSGRGGGQRCLAASRRSAARPRHIVAGGKVYLDPVQDVAVAFAPATIANLGPGFDWLGCAVEGEGDTVTARVLIDQPGKVVIEGIQGDGGCWGALAVAFHLRWTRVCH